MRIIDTNNHLGAVKKGFLKSSYRLFFVALSTITLIPTTSSFAVTSPATQGGGQALEIAPPLITQTVNPGQKLTFTIQIRDIASDSLLVSTEANDFIAGGEGGTPKILLDQNYSDPYSMKNWVEPIPQMLLKPQEIKPITVTVNVPKDASPGGHYGVIRFSAKPPELSGQGVSLSASLGSLVLLTVNGNIQDNLSITQFSVGKNNKSGSFFESGPVTFTEKIKNTGNVHEEPAGSVAVTDMFGHAVGAVNVNLPPGNILPASTREFTQNFDKTVIGNKMLFGRYTAKMHLIYSKDKKTLDATLTFWVIPWKKILIIIVSLVVLFFLLRFLIRRYNRRIIKKASSSKK